MKRPTPSKKASKKAASKTAKARQPIRAKSELDPRLERIAKTYLREPRVSLGKLFSSRGLEVDGKIFAMVVRGKLVLKLPKSRVDELVAKKAGSYFDPGHGRLMKEWIAMRASKPDPLSLAREAFVFVSGQK